MGELTKKRHIANISDIDIRSSRTICVEGKQLAIFRLTDGSIHAVDNKCPHKGGVLSEGMVCGTHLHCPLHDWKIDLRSGLVQAPDQGSISTYKVEVDPANGHIYLTI